MSGIWFKCRRGIRMFSDRPEYRCLYNISYSLLAEDNEGWAALGIHLAKVCYIACNRWCDRIVLA